MERAEAVVRCSAEKVFLKIWQNLKENTCFGIALFYRIPSVAATERR